MKVLINFVLIIGSYQIYHSDIKRPNIVVLYDKLNRLVIKIIDLGEASFEYDKIYFFTKKYMPAIGLI